MASRLLVVTVAVLALAILGAALPSPKDHEEKNPGYWKPYPYHYPYYNYPYYYPYHQYYNYYAPYYPYSYSYAHVNHAVPAGKAVAAEE